MEKFDPIDIEFLINSDEVKVDARKVKNEIQGIKNSSDSEAKKVMLQQDKILRGISDKYKGIVSESLKTFNSLSKDQQANILQLNELAGSLDHVSNAQKQLNIDFDAGKIKANQYRQAQASLNAEELRLRGQMKRMSSELGVQKQRWNGLGNSINQISRELTAFTYSAQTGFLALSNNIPILADEIGRLKAENDALVASGKKGVPIWKQVVSSLFSWQTALALGVTLITIYGKEISEWVTSLFKGKEALDELKASKEKLNEAFESSEFKDATVSLAELKINLDLAKEGMVDKKAVVDQYNKSIGTVAKNAKDLDDVEQGLVKNADLYIEMTLKKAAANLALEDAAKKSLEAAQEAQKSATEFANAGDKVTANMAATGGLGGSMYGTNTFDHDTYNKSIKEDGEKRKKARLEQLEDEKKSMEDIAADFMKDAAKAAEKMGGVLLGGPEDPEQKIVNDRKNLLEKIADLDREYARKQLNRDDEELQALRDKFSKVRELIEEFNNDPKNKEKKIDITGLGVIQANAEEDLTYRQETRSMAEELEKQKKLYREIEEYKATFGIEKTRERYKEELKQYENYAALLRQKVVNNTAAFDAVENGTANAAQTERVKLLQSESKEEQQIAKEKYVALLEEFMTYQAKRKLLTEQFQEDYNTLILAQNFEEAEMRKKQYEEDLNDLDDHHIKKKEEYKDLFREVSRLSIAEGKKLIEEANRFIADNPLMSEEMRQKILKLISETREQVDGLQEDQIYKAARAFGILGQELSAIGTELGSPALTGIGGFLTDIAYGIEDVMSAMDEEATWQDKLSAGLNSAVRLMGMVASASQRRKAAEEEYYRSVIGFQNDYNLGLQEQIRLQSILEESVFIKDYEGRITDANEALLNANSQYEEALKKLGQGRVKTGQRNAVDWGNVGSGAASGAALGATIGSVVPVIGNVVGAIVGGIGGALAGLFGGKKKKDTWGSLLGEYPELLQETEDGVIRVNDALAESLIENNLLDDATKQIVQNVLDWQKAIDEARAQIREVITDLTGSLSDDLRTALVDAFQSGEDAAVAMGNTVEKVLENILSNLIFNRIFSDAFAKLEEDMAASYDVGGDGNWVDDFASFFDEASELSDDFNNAMGDARDQAGRYGFDIFQPDDDDEPPAGLQGAIRRELTEETGSELTGLFRGQFDVTKRHLQLHERHFELEQRHVDYTRTIMQYSALIEQNTAATVIQLQYAVTELKTISKQTKSSQSARDMGK